MDEKVLHWITVLMGAMTIVVCVCLYFFFFFFAKAVLAAELQM